MLCCQCGKNQATKTREKITDGKKQTEYYCAACYDRLFLSIEEPVLGDAFSKVCPYCGTTAEEFFALGVVGCARCYDSLSEVLLPSIEKVQGTEPHRGKKPYVSQEISELIQKRNFVKAQAERLIREKKFADSQEYSKELSRLNKLLYGKEGV